MNLYTVILEFNGGTYVSQNSADNELSALIFWANNPSDEMLAELGFLDSRNQWITEIVSAIENNTSWLSSLDTLKSVWFFYFSHGDNGGFVHIVKTSS